MMESKKNLNKEKYLISTHIQKNSNIKGDMMIEVDGNECPECGAKEISVMSARTHYSCGSSDYDGRPGTKIKGEKCKLLTEFEG